MNSLELLACSDWSVGSVVFQRCLRYVLGHFLTSAEISRKNPDHYPERMPLFLSISSSFIISEFLGRTEIKLSTLLQGQTAGMFTESISIWFFITPLHSLIAQHLKSPQQYDFFYLSMLRYVSCFPSCQQGFFNVKNQLFGE